MSRHAGESNAAPCQLEDGSALEELGFGSPDWLVGEILSYRGEAVVLEPEDLRTQGGRAREVAGHRARGPEEEDEGEGQGEALDRRALTR